jgi:hypothetical protein
MQSVLKTAKGVPMLLRFHLPFFFLVLISMQIRAGAEVFIAPFSGNLYLKCTGGSAGATSQFGTGTSPATFKAYLSGLPGCPTAEVLVGAVTGGQSVPFGIETFWNGQTYWAFSTSTDQGSTVSFSDVCNTLGMGGRIIQQTSSTTWLMHLNDAAHYTLDQCEANNILIQLRLDSSSVNGPPMIFVQNSQSFTTLSGSNPPPSSLSVTGNIGMTFTATASSAGNWLSINPTTGITPAVINVSANTANLNPGTYTGTVTVASAAAFNGPQTSQITLTVQDGSLLNASPSGLTFGFAIGGPTQPQTISLSSLRAGLAFTTGVSGGSWLSVSPSTGATPANISVSINPGGLGIGTYTANITVLSSGASNPVQTIPVSLVVNPPSVPPSFTAAGIVNAASFVSGLVPGSLATLFGKGLSIVNGAVLARQMSWQSAARE